MHECSVLPDLVQGTRYTFKALSHTAVLITEAVLTVSHTLSQGGTPLVLSFKSCFMFQLLLHVAWEAGLYVLCVYVGLGICVCARAWVYVWVCMCLCVCVWSPGSCGILRQLAEGWEGQCFCGRSTVINRQPIYTHTLFHTHTQIPKHTRTYVHTQTYKHFSTAEYISIIKHSRPTLARCLLNVNLGQ